VFERLLNEPPYALRQSEKEAILLEGLNELTRYHYERSPEYARILDVAWGGLKSFHKVSEVPYLPVGLFKEMELKSTATPSFVMRSSGTTGQRTSRIVIDNETARRQSEALVASFRPILGARRLPFLAIDTKDVIKPTDLTARGGGVLGMMKFGAKTTFALDPQLEIDRQAVEAFVGAYGRSRFSFSALRFSFGTSFVGPLPTTNSIFRPPSSFTPADGKSSRRKRFRTLSSGPPLSADSISETSSTSTASSSRSARSSSRGRTDCSIRRISPMSSSGGRTAGSRQESERKG
jgi:Acyl-protein synthetase, LuxE